MAAARTGGAPSRFASQAQVNALLRYSPQREALKQLTMEAQGQARESVRGAESAGRLTSAAVQKAVPVVQDIFNRAQGTQTEAQSGLGAQLAALGSAANGYKAAVATEAAAGQGKLARERASTESGLQEQQVAASEAPQFAHTLAAQQLLSSLGKIYASEKSLGGQEAASSLSEAEKLQAAAEGRATTERGQNLTARSQAEGHRITAQSDAEGHRLAERGLSQKAAEHRETLAGKTKEASSKEQNAAIQAFSTMHEKAKALSGEGYSRGAILHALSQPIPSKSGEDANGNKISTKGRAGYAPDAVMAAALDVAELGGLKPTTEARLRAQHYDPRRFGKPVSISGGASQLAKKAKQAVEGF